MNYVDTSKADFFLSLSEEEQMIVLEVALQGLRDELTDGFMREMGILDLDLSDETLVPVHDKLARYMEDEA